MSSTNNAFFFSILLLFTGQIPAKEEPFSQVKRTVKARTGRDVRWEQDIAARNENRDAVRTLLQSPLTADGAVRVALLNNRGLQATFEEIGLSYADVRQARTLTNPSLDVAVKIPDRGPKRPLDEWGLTQNFLDLLVMPLRTHVARTALASTQMRVADEVVKLVAEVKSGYYRLLADQQLSQRLGTMIEAEGSSLELMQRLHEAGNVTDLALLQEQAQYSRSRLVTAAAEAERREEREKLNRLFGVWGRDVEWRLAATELPPVPAQEMTMSALETLAISNRLDLAASRAALEAAVKAAGLEKRFRFVGGLEFGIVGEHEPDGGNLTGPSLHFELPIFNQGQARMVRGEARLRMAAAKFEELAIDIRSQVRVLRDRLISKRDLARFYREEMLPTRRHITALTLTEFNAMVLGGFELFQARKEDLDAERAMIEATRDYWITRAELERAVGGALRSAGGERGLVVSENKTVIKPKAHD